MEKILQQIFVTQQVSTHRNQGILIAPVLDIAQGFRLAREVLYELVDKKTALFLSGGKTPKQLYRKIAEEKKLSPGVVGQVDERYGKPMHESSNELLFKDSGLLTYLQEQKVKFCSMLPARHPEHAAATFDVDSGSKQLDSRFSGNDGEEMRKMLAEDYDQLLRHLFTIYPTSLATLGIGIDGHIAGIAPNRADFHNSVFDQDQKLLLVSTYNDKEGSFKERITLTFLGLSMLDYLVVLVFGDEKKEALAKLFEPGKEEDIPARFLKRVEIAAKTLIITDQAI